MYCSVILIVMCLVFKLMLRPCTFISVSCFFSSKRRKFIKNKHTAKQSTKYNKESQEA